MKTKDLPNFDEDYGVIAHFYSDEFKFLSELDIQVIECFLSGLYTSSDMADPDSESRFMYDEQNNLYPIKESKPLIYQEYATARMMLRFNPYIDNCSMINKEVAKVFEYWSNLQYITNDTNNPATDEVIICFRNKPIAIFSS